MASAELLKMTHVVDSKVVGVDDRVKSVEGKVQDIRGNIYDVGNKVQDVEGRVQGVRDDVHDVGNRVQLEVQDVGNQVQDVDHRVRGVDDKLDQVNRALFFYFPPPIPSIHASWQGSTSERIFSDGFHPRIHPPIITSHATLVTMVQLNGFFKELYLINGNPLGPCCGYTENVRCSRILSIFDS